MPALGVIGGGTMGAGIAQVAATAGWQVALLDASSELSQKAIDNIRRQLVRLAEKGKLKSDDAQAIAERLQPAHTSVALGDCDLVIEAIVEDMNAKIDALIPVIKAARRSTIVATNTSSLSVTKLGFGISAAPRTVGMHFFNPAPLMPLVEIVAGDHSEPGVVQRATEIAREWGKTAVLAKDTPGFIVNRVARSYYLEPLRMLAEGVAGVNEIDAMMKSLGGFRMGPFELMDLIGIDVNYSVSCSVWEQLGRPARLTPSPVQKSLVERQMVGRKSKIGFYSYQTESPVPAVPVERRSFDLPEPIYKAVRLFCQKAAVADGSITEQFVFARTLAAIINEAGYALDQGVASEPDIDLAMKLGTNYPRGPIEWAQSIGLRTTRHLLDVLNARSEDARFDAAAWLKG